MELDVNRLCMGCMAGEADPDQPCPLCGFCQADYAPKPQVLPLRTILNGKYLLGRMIGQGGFGIIYLGWDLNLDMKLAIKEYYPSGFVTRDCTQSAMVTSYTGEEQAFFSRGLEKFIDEAKRLAKFYALPGIVSVRDYFQENGTAYIVMEFIEGLTLREYLKEQGERLAPEEILEMMRPVLDSLCIVHQQGIIHRDISPDNLMIDQQGKIHLLDFGAAREFEREGSQTILLKHGYAPYEQYQSRGNQGPWTDVYALCATIYRCITGEVPPEAPSRVPKDPLQKPSSLGVSLSHAQEAALMKGLAVDWESRWRSVEELGAALYPKEEKKPHPKLKPEPKPKEGPSPLERLKDWADAIPKKQKRLAAGGCGLVLALALVLRLVSSLPALTGPAEVQREEPPQSSSSQAASQTPVVAPIEQWGGQEASGSDTSSLRQPENPEAVVRFADPALEAYLRGALNKPIEPITEGDLAGIEKLHIYYDSYCAINQEDLSEEEKAELSLGTGEIRSLKDLSYCLNLKELTLYFQLYAEDLSPLSGLTSLEKLNLAHMSAKNLAPLSNLTNLSYLDLSNTYVTDLSPIAQLPKLATLVFESMEAHQLETLPELTNLRCLDLSFCEIEDLSLLSGMSRLEELDLSNLDLTDLSSLASLTNLRVLDIGLAISQEQDISPLSQLSKLQELDLSSCQVSSIEALSGLTDLRSLDIYDCGVSDLSPLAGMKELRSLNIGNNPVQDLSVLAGFEHLEELRYFGGKAKNFSSISNLTNLKHLSIDAPDSSVWKNAAQLETLVLAGSLTQLPDLSGFDNLRELTVNSGRITSLEPLADLVNLEKLSLDRNQITSLKPLTGLVNLEELSLEENQITSLEPLAGLMNLEKLWLRKNYITSIEPLAGLVNLERLYLERNQITSIEPLAGLVNLEKLYLDGNQITSLEPLTGLVNLISLDIDDNQVTSLSPLANLNSDCYLSALYNNITDWSPVDHVEVVLGRPEED